MWLAFSFGRDSRKRYRAQLDLDKDERKKERDMNQEWKKPELEEIPLSCEITAYSNAELPTD